MFSLSLLLVSRQRSEQRHQKKRGGEEEEEVEEEEEEEEEVIPMHLPSTFFQQWVQIPRPEISIEIQLLINRPAKYSSHAVCHNPHLIEHQEPDGSPSQLPQLRYRDGQLLDVEPPIQFPRLIIGRA